MTSTSTNCAPNSTSSPQPEKKGGRSAARGAHHRRLRGNPAVRRDSTAAPRSTAKTATSSSGSMPCASTACARLRNAASLLAPLDHQGLLAGAADRRRRAGGSDGRRRAAGRAGGRGRRGRHHRTSPCPHQRREARRRGNRQSHRTARTSSSFKPLFEQVQKELEAGVRQTRPVRD